MQAEQIWQSQIAITVLSITASIIHRHKCYLYLQINVILARGWPEVKSGIKSKHWDTQVFKFYL